MDKLTGYRQAIEEIMTSYTQILYAHGEVEPKAVFDRTNDQYLLLAVGWDGVKRVHGTIVHVEIRDGKVWIQQDGTESGVAGELEERGVPASEIVLGFRPAELRPHTGYAVA